MNDYLIELKAAANWNVLSLDLESARVFGEFIPLTHCATKKRAKRPLSHVYL